MTMTKRNTMPKTFREESDEETWPDQQGESDKDNDNDQQKVNDKDKDKDIDNDKHNDKYI